MTSPKIMSNMAIDFWITIFLDILSFSILGKKEEKNKVTKKIKTYWIPRSALIIAKLETGTKDIANVWEKAANPPTSWVKSTNSKVFLPGADCLPKASFLFLQG